MQSPLQKLAVHLLAASSVPIAVFAALAGLWMLSGWFGPVEFERVMIRAAVPVLFGVAISMYPIYFLRIIRAYQQRQSPMHVAASSPRPEQPPKQSVVIRNHTKTVGLAALVFLLFLGVGISIGTPAEGTNVDLLTYYSFRWLGRATLFLGAVMLVFSIALMTTNALRGILRTFYWELNGDRPRERRINFPLEVAVAAVPLFVGVVVGQLPP